MIDKTRAFFLAAALTAAPGTSLPPNPTSGMTQNHKTGEDALAPPKNANVGMNEPTRSGEPRTATTNSGTTYGMNSDHKVMSRPSGVSPNPPESSGPSGGSK
jgi:hypothetical protein